MTKSRFDRRKGSTTMNKAVLKKVADRAKVAAILNDPSVAKAAVRKVQKATRPSADDIAARTKTDGRAPAVKIADLEAANASLKKRLYETEAISWKRKRDLDLSQVTIATLAAEIERLTGSPLDNIPF
jgi:hypothetical protein